ncbi:MAG: hypothetical protein R3240_01270 [Gammaproteobacteria bacterium]|nr:hypothetical protein [Gammaproteobacteria bacterium]
MDWQNEKLIYKCQDDFGEMFIKELGLIRSLYFRDKKQSSLFMPESAVLVLSYAQAMMTSLLFQPDPKKVLILGLGGGSLFHFLHNFFPNCQIEIVELRKTVIDLSHQLFKLPQNNSHLQVVHGDARRFVSESVLQSKSYDLVLVDTFDQWGPTEFLSNIQFIRDCYALLTKDGICSFNLWNRKEDAYQQTVGTFEKVFNGNCLELRLGRVNSNAILHGFARQFNPKDLKNFKQTACEYEEKFGINFPHYHKLLMQQNVSLFKDLKKVMFT